MNLADELVVLCEKLALLEQGSAMIGDWHRLEARAARALIHGQGQLALLQREMIEVVRMDPPDPKWFALLSRVQRLRDCINEVRLVRMSAASRILELQAEAN